jgi:hypothetical protein
MAKELIAQGVEPLQAFTQAGFAYPAREVKRQAGAVAEAQGKDPMQVLVDVARYGSPVDVVAACAAILRVDDDQPNTDVGLGTQIFVQWVRREVAA